MEGAYTPVGINVAALPITEIVPVFFFLIFFVWAIYTIVAAYHWFRYSNNTTMALTVMTTHLVVSAVLAIFTVSGIH
jgi:hypothetical protein